MEAHSDNLPETDGPLPAGGSRDSGPEAYVTKDLSTIRELIHPARLPGLGMSLAEAVVEESCSTASHRHLESDEIYYCLEGAGHLFIDGVEHDFFPDNYYLIPRRAEHHLKAVTRLRLLCFCCPAYSHEDTILREQAEQERGAR